LRSELSTASEWLQDLSNVAANMTSRNVNSTRFSPHTVPDLSVRYKKMTSYLLCNLGSTHRVSWSTTKSREVFLEKKILETKASGVSSEQIDEFKEVFEFFDKDKSGKLNRLEFKSCLQSLGEDPSV